MFGKDRITSLATVVLVALFAFGGAILLSRLPPAGSVQVVLSRLPPAGSVQVVLPPSTSTPLPTHTPSPIRVYVCGAVNRPDVYELPAGSIVKDAILAAGGATDSADLVQINLAEVLEDEAQVYVPMQGEAPAAVQVPQRSGGIAGSGGVDINTASLDELQTLPGIGPVLAQRIVDNRPYRDAADILEVPGIGEATYARLKELIVVQ